MICQREVKHRTNPLPRSHRGSVESAVRVPGGSANSHVGTHSSAYTGSWSAERATPSGVLDAPNGGWSGHDFIAPESQLRNFGFPAPESQLRNFGFPAP